jgi:hypothetical protein
LGEKISLDLENTISIRISPAYIVVYQDVVLPLDRSADLFLTKETAATWYQPLDQYGLLPV